MLFRSIGRDLGVNMLRPERKQSIRYGWPGLVRHRMVRLITVATAVRDPAQRAAIGHAHGKRLATRRYGDVQGRLFKYRLKGANKTVLRLWIKPTGQELETAHILEDGAGRMGFQGI